MEGFVAYRSRWRLALMTVLMTAGAAITLEGAVALDPGSSSIRLWDIVMVWFGFLFSGACAVAFLGRLLGAREMLRIGPAGIYTPYWSDRTVPWSEILDVTTLSYGSYWQTRWLVLHFRDGAPLPALRWAAKFPVVKKLIVRKKVTISFLETNRRLQEALDAIARHRPHQWLSTASGWPIQRPPGRRLTARSIEK